MILRGLAFLFTLLITFETSWARDVELDIQENEIHIALSPWELAERNPLDWNDREAWTWAKQLSTPFFGAQFGALTTALGTGICKDLSSKCEGLPFGPTFEMPTLGGYFGGDAGAFGACIAGGIAGMVITVKAVDLCTKAYEFLQGIEKIINRAHTTCLIKHQGISPTFSRYLRSLLLRPRFLKSSGQRFLSPVLENLSLNELRDLIPYLNGVQISFDDLQSEVNRKWPNLSVEQQLQVQHPFYRFNKILCTED